MREATVSRLTDIIAEESGCAKQIEKLVSRTVQSKKKEGFCSNCSERGHSKRTCTNDRKCSRCLCPHHSRDDTPSAFGGCTECAGKAMSQINTPGAFAVIDNTRCIAICPICNHPGTRAGHRSSKAGCVECIQNRTGDSCDAIHAEYHRSRRRTSVGNSEGNEASSSTAENESDVDNESEVIIQPPGLMNSELALEIEEEEDACIDVTTSLLEEVFKTREGDDECTTIFDEVIDLVDGNDDSEFTVVTVLDDTALEAALDGGAASSQDQDVATVPK